MSPDVFAEYALTEEQTAPVSPIRRRRPSDVGMPRSKTNKELTNDIEKLKDTLMTTNMRVELLKKNNSELQHEVTKAKEQLEELDALEEENLELRNENSHLKLKVEDMDEEIDRLRDANDAIRETNEELSALVDESATHWQDQEMAIDEAAECIIKLEEEKSTLAAEINKLMERVSALENTADNSTLVDGSPGRYPSRVYSVDESRPSTSHFDSDYYSQPASPQVQPSRESISSITPSERSKKFLDLSEERRKSARDLGKRISAASLRALSMRFASPAPEVPQIPAQYQQQTEEVFIKTVSLTPKTPGRYRKGRSLVPPSLLDEALISPTRTTPTAEQIPKTKPDGLRGLYRPDRLIRSKTSTDTRRQVSATETSPNVPSRGSSRHAYTNSSSEHLQAPSPRHRRQSEPDLKSADSTPRTHTDDGYSEWASLAPPPSVSVVSDLTSELDPRTDKDRWWRNMEGLTQSQELTRSTPQRTVQPRNRDSTQVVVTRPRSPPPQVRADDAGMTTRSSKNGEKRSKTQPSTPGAYKGDCLIFNAAEDEDTFLRRLRTGLSSGLKR